jgi:hypothetical protein
MRISQNRILEMEVPCPIHVSGCLGGGGGGASVKCLGTGSEVTEEEK